MTTLTTSAPKSVNKSLLSTEGAILADFEKKMRSIYERGGLCGIKGRQLFVNKKSLKPQLRLQHLEMLHRDNDVLSTKGSLVYYVSTAKDTNMKKINTNKIVFKKFFFVKTDQTEGKLAVRDYYIADKSNMSADEIAQFIDFDLPAFTDLNKSVLEMISSKQLNKIQASFAMDYFAFLARCLGKQPRFSLTQEESSAVLEYAIDPEWVQNTLNTAWLAVNPSFKQ